MANKSRGFGLTAELARKLDGKWDADQANDIIEWIVSVLDHGGKDELAHEINPVKDSAGFAAIFKDGQLLCHMVNVIRPNSVKKINPNKMAFKQMENVGNFLRVCEDLGMAKQDLFQTVDLFEARNIPQVVTTIGALGRKTHDIDGYDGPTFGVKESIENKREFTQDQLRAGEGIINLQAGSNKGASQAGQNFGKTRAIID